MASNKEVFQKAFDDIATTPMDNGTPKGRNGMFDEFDNSRSPKTEIAKTSLYMDINLMTRARIYCIQKRYKMTNFITEAIEFYLSAKIKEEQENERTGE